MMTHRQVKTVLILMATFVVLAGLLKAVHGQCVNGQCPSGQCQTPQPRWEATIQIPKAAVKAVVQKPHPAICKIYAECSVTIGGRQAKERSIGSGVLVWKGQHKATVITVQHLFRRWPSKVICIFPNGTQCEAERVQTKKAPDLGMLTIPAPKGVDPITMYTETPEVGEQVRICGYDGPSGQYRENIGVVQGYGMHEGQPARHDLIVSGGASEGQSGGAMINNTGHLVGVIWGTDDATTRGTFNGALCQFLGDGQYIVPWNAELAGEKYKADAQVQAAQIQAQAAQRAPLVAPVQNGVNTGIDAQARQMGQNNASELQSIGIRLGQVKETLGISVGNLGEDVIALQDKVAEQDETLVGKVQGLVKASLFSFFKQWGMAGGVVATLIFFYLRKRAMKLAQWADWLTDKIPGKLDDKLLDPLFYGMAHGVSGKPVPPQAYTPGLNPWGQPYDQAPTQQPVQPPVEPTKPA